MKAWTEESRTDVLKGPWIHVTRSRFVTGSGVVLDPFYLKHDPDWVVVLARDSKGLWQIVRQYRPGADRFCWEFPAGTVDAGEEPLAAAQRELQEETGFTGGRWIHLASLHANPAHGTNLFHVYLALDVSPCGERHLDPGEEIENHSWTTDYLKEQLQNLNFDNPHHRCAWQLALEHL